MRKIVCVCFCLLLLTGSCTQQATDAALPPDVIVGNEYIFGFFTGEQRLTVLQVTDGWVKVRDTENLIFWLNRDAINTVRDVGGK